MNFDMDLTFQMEEYDLDFDVHWNAEALILELLHEYGLFDIINNSIPGPGVISQPDHVTFRWCVISGADDWKYDLVFLACPFRLWGIDMILFLLKQTSINR